MRPTLVSTGKSFRPSDSSRMQATLLRPRPARVPVKCYHMSFFEAQRQQEAARRAHATQACQIADELPCGHRQQQDACHPLGASGVQSCGCHVPS